MKKLGLGLLLVLVISVFAACSAPLDLIDYDATLSPANEVPPVVDSNAAGLVQLELNGMNLSVVNTPVSSVRDLSSAPTAAHIHPGCAGQENPPLPNGMLTIAADPAGGANVYKITGSATLTEAQVEQLNSDCLYVNVHTENYPEGEVRGQITRLLGE